jgi:bifunctional DNA-binding transcriptional regulator/antitoxin component of YhaV-PrlF toxin-antitoxin module
MGTDVLRESKISRGFLTVVPRDVRQAMGAREGDRLEWQLRGTELMVRVRRPVTMEDIVGIVSHGGDAVASKKTVQGLRDRVR